MQKKKKIQKYNMPNTFKYNIQERETKKNGTLYDLYFYIQTPDGRKQKLLRGFKTKKLARQAYEQFMEKHLVAPQKYDGKNIVRYELARREYLGFVRNTVKESSLYDFIHTAKKHYDDFFAGRDMQTVTKQDIIEWQDQLWAKTYRGKLYTQKTLTKIYGQFAVFYSWCVEHYGLDDALKGVKMPKRKDNKEPRQIWTEAEFERFIASVDNIKYKALFTTLFYCGCRIGELQALQSNDYDGQKLFVHGTFTRKTMDDSQYRITETKNYKSRYVPLPEKATAVLDEWLSYKKAHKISNAYIFGENDPISLNAIQNAFTRGIEKSAVKKLRIHDLRHSYVSLLMSKGANFGVIAALIGDTLEQVVKTYAHHTEEDKTKIISLI